MNQHDTVLSISVSVLLKLQKHVLSDHQQKLVSSSTCPPYSRANNYRCASQDSQLSESSVDELCEQLNQFYEEVRYANAHYTPAHFSSPMIQNYFRT